MSTLDKNGLNCISHAAKTRKTRLVKDVYGKPIKSPFKFVYEETEEGQSKTKTEAEKKDENTEEQEEKREEGDQREETEDEKQESDGAGSSENEEGNTDNEESEKEDKKVSSVKKHHYEGQLELPAGPKDENFDQFIKRYSTLQMLIKRYKPEEKAHYHRVVRYLLKKGVDPNKVDNLEDCPLSYAAAKGNFRVIQQLAQNKKLVVDVSSHFCQG
ncbi:hypothetical protein Ciccas_012863 [Cichlidogyrus casuarinus]|uniref:Uncharacterized protein n=1 Tax=Cichlidogyrus casuarinus TaxID=1844966 RepID=A0ABD2PM44_9PLAT